ncbi:PepSY-associated TM helix domain-containing protein [Zobellella sp. DQSA1]|uniref:PepSY-associated TM helix domain-containing protein n=1 Tax=Zobellella sp. DQSA1 TaxID=3342386 RepID=UPI0035BF7577
MPSQSTRFSQAPRWVRPLHTYSSMLMLVIMLFFTFTGLTLNNRHWLPEPEPEWEAELSLPETLAGSGLWREDPLLAASQVWLWMREEQQLAGGEVRFDWSEDEGLLLIDIKRPGGYSLVEVLPEEGEVWLASRHYGWMAVLNDLHMGRYSGPGWRWFIDASALVMLLFTLTGLWLVLPMRRRRGRMLTLSGLGTALMAGIYVWMLF